MFGNSFPVYSPLPKNIYYYPFILILLEYLCISSCMAGAYNTSTSFIMDIWNKKKRSAVMAKIRSKDTKPEWIVRRYLFSRGYRYRKNVKGLPGTPDIVLRKYGIAIFIHGCFWHGHEVDGHIPHSNTTFWQKKIERNRLRDEKNKQELKKMGWKVMTIWECQLKPAVRQQTLLEMEYHINHTYLERFKPKVPKPYIIEECPIGFAAEGEGEYALPKD